MVASPAGQAPAGDDVVFQSPSLRGSGRFTCGDGCSASASRSVSIPFIAGQWSLPDEPTIVRALTRACFNPLHCGAVVASPGGAGSGERTRERFNPLHCGAVVASDRFAGAFVLAPSFQSPSLRGSGRFRRYAKSVLRDVVGRVSIPFIAGQWSLLPPSPSPSPTPTPVRFNPLHCGAVVASPSHNAPLVLRRPAAEFATSLRPRSLGVLAQVA